MYVSIWSILLINAVCFAVTPKIKCGDTQSQKLDDIQLGELRAIKQINKADDLIGIELNKLPTQEIYSPILQGAIVHPNLRQVLPIMPEQICNTDGNDKQDCELNAAKRFIEDLRQDHPQMKITVGGDGLNSKQPFIEILGENRMNFILVAKPDDHKKMMEAIEICRLAGEVNSLNIIDEKDRRHHYEWVNNIPLNGNDDAIQVNYFFMKF
jgi:hypothetical protein